MTWLEGLSVTRPMEKMYRTPDGGEIRGMFWLMKSVIYSDYIILFKMDARLPMMESVTHLQNI
jgi:hypothetical protein